MWTTVTEALLFCVVLWLYVLLFEHRYLTEMRDHQWQTIETVLDCVNTALRGMQRSMQSIENRRIFPSVFQTQ